jgi:hypothetical protein
MEETRTYVKQDKFEAYSKKPIVKIQSHCWSKMYGWCKAAKSEVSGMGMARIVDGCFEVYDVFFPKQYCSSGWTELDEEALSELQQKLYLKKRDLREFRFWWHTHYNFDTFWSGQDNSMAQKLAETNGEWSLSLVINQKDEYKCRIDFKKPIDVTLDDIEVKIIANSVKRKRKRNFKQDILKWVHPMPVKVDTKAGSKFVWSKDNIQKIVEEFKGTEWEEQVKKYLEERKPKKYFDKDTGRLGKEILKPAFGEGGAWQTINGVTRRIPKGACTCMHGGDWQDCFCLPDCNVCSEIQMGLGELANGSGTIQKSIWPA